MEDYIHLRIYQTRGSTCGKNRVIRPDGQPGRIASFPLHEPLRESFLWPDGSLTLVGSTVMRLGNIPGRFPKAEAALETILSRLPAGVARGDRHSGREGEYLGVSIRPTASSTSLPNLSRQLLTAGIPLPAAVEVIRSATRAVRYGGSMVVRWHDN